jgi:aminoglycoside phosphotransferase (APT) family kinase protein
MPDWTPEVVVDRTAARRLIGEQFPEFDHASMQLLGEGWDVTTWLVDDSVCFRFPRRAIVVAGLNREMEVLPVLDALLPLPISTPLFKGVPSGSYLWPFAGNDFIPGIEICDADLDDRARAALAEPLAVFLRRLHSHDVQKRISGLHRLPVDPMGRGDMSRRVPWARDALLDVQRLQLWKPPAAVEKCFQAAERLPIPRATVVVHGDLHLRHLLVDGGKAAGIIDWIDVCLASRSIDLVLYWSLLPAEARNLFVDCYGPVGREDLVRARVLAFGLSAMLAVYARDKGLRSLELEAIAGLERTASG